MSTTLTTENLFNGDNSNKDFTITFPYLQEADVKVEHPLGTNITAFSFLNATTIRFTSAPASGTNNVRIYRDTNVDTAKAVYATGSSMRATDLNNNQEQLLFSAQERIYNNRISGDAVTGTEIKDDSIDSEHYVDASIDLQHLSSNSVDSSKIVDGSIVNADINSSAAIDGSKIAASTTSAPGTISAADKTKLDGIETGATADQTNAEIRAAVAAATDSNVFTNAKLEKLDAIEASATADQTDAEIRAAVAAATDSNVFTNAKQSKLDAIEASADVTDATNVDAAGAVMNSDLDGKGELLVGDGSGDPTALAVGTNNYVLTADSSEATGVKWTSAATGTPEGTVILSTGESGGTKFLREDGDGTCSWQAVAAGSDTTYSVSCVDGDNSDEEKIRLTAGGSGSGTDDVVLEAGTGLSIARDGDKITFTNTVTDTTLTNEAVQDVVGAMFTGNTETNITATYQDADGTIDLVVSGGEITVQDEGSSLSTAATILNFVGDGVAATGTGATKTITIAGGGGATSTDFQYLELKAHNNTSGAFSAGSADYELVTKGTTTAVTPSQAASLLISVGGVIQEPNTGTSIGSNDGFCIDGSSIHFGANLTAHPEFILYLKGAGVASIADNTVTGAKIALGSDASGDIMYYNGTDYVRLAKGTDGEVLKLASGAPSWAADAGLSQEQVEDYVGGMVTGNTETGIAVTYDDSDGTLDFVVADQTPTTTRGDIIYRGASADQRLAKGSAGQVLKMGANDPEWGAASVGTITALNNQAANRLTTIGSTTTELDGEANLTFDGTDLTVAAGGAVVSSIYENPKTLTANHTIGTDNNAMVAGPFSVGSATLTIPSGSVFTVI